jgi:hypothetical protein
VGNDFSQDVAGEDAHPQGWLALSEFSMRVRAGGMATPLRCHQVNWEMARL